MDSRLDVQFNKNMGQRLDVTGTKWDTLGSHRVEPNIDWTENMNRTESVVKLKSFSAAFSR